MLLIAACARLNWASGLNANKNGVQQLKPHQRCRYPDQATNFNRFRGSFLTVQIGSTFSRSPIHTRLSKEFDDQTKLYRPDQAAGFAACITLARMWVARWLAAAVVGMVGIACIAMAVWTLTARDWHPTRGLRSDDLNRIRIATEFVESSKKSLGRMPTMQEFDLWSRSAPTELRLDGVGFSYGPSGTTVGAAYAFDWYGGRGTWLSWRSDTLSPELADISPSVYFVFGHKLVDLVVFFGLGVLAFAFAGWMVRGENVNDAR